MYVYPPIWGDIRPDPPKRGDLGVYPPKWGDLGVVGDLGAEIREMLKWTCINLNPDL